MEKTAQAETPRNDKEQGDEHEDIAMELVAHSDCEHISAEVARNHVEW